MASSITKEITINLSPREAASDALILQELRRQKVLGNMEVNSFKIVRKSIDARKKDIKVNLRVIVSSEKEIKDYPIVRDYKKLNDNAPEIIIVGAGPAGLFAGLKAIELGLRPVILERGKDVDSRRIDIAAISREGKINPDSNYCFGEGGAGAFSDGKLYTRSKKRGNITEVLEILHQFGASADILVQAHPHIGSDKLPSVIRNIRKKIKECGGDVRFGCRMSELLLKDKKALGVKTGKGEIIHGPVVLATGHSARDVFRMLKEKNVKIEAKGIAIGVRLEHPQNLIDRMQYHNPKGRGEFLPPAEYSFVNQSDGRGVYTFCMCPGGVIVPAVSEKDQIVVNGMSASARSGRWANSGYVVELHPGDIPGFESENEFEMLALQESLEHKFSQYSKGELIAPAQKINDFVKNKVSEELPPTSYAPGIKSADLQKLFPKEIGERLKDGLLQIGKHCKEFISDKGVMIGLESRTSSPVRIPRNNETLEHTEIEDLYPVGEGAGYAGGIVSSALDGMNSVLAYFKKINGHG